ncbi:hypothetical protein FRC07_011467, partial [Ceratobasidium sp. 392]
MAQKAGHSEQRPLQPALPQAPTANKTCRRTRALQFACFAAVVLVILRGISVHRASHRDVCPYPPPEYGGIGKVVHGAKAKLPSHYTLPSGDAIPSVALGTWQAPRGQVGEAVKIALRCGYRHIDGAWAYRNEEEVGQAIKDAG